MKRVLKSRRGNALPIAIVTMVVIFALCGLLMSLALYSNRLSEVNKKFFDQRLALDSIAEECRAALKDKSEIPVDALQTKYGYTIQLSSNFHPTTEVDGAYQYETGCYILTVNNKSNLYPLLTVVYRVENGTVSVEQYVYRALTTEENAVYTGALGGN